MYDFTLTGLPDDLPVFTQKEAEQIILQNRIHAWLINTSEFGSSWSISPYGAGFELSCLGRTTYDYYGKVYWNGTCWLAYPLDGEAKGFDSIEDARVYLEGLAKSFGLTSS